MHSLLKFHFRHLIFLKGVPFRSNTVMIKGATTYLYVYIYGMEHSSSGTNLHMIFFLSGTYIIFHRRFVQHVFKELCFLSGQITHPSKFFFNKQTLNSVRKLSMVWNAERKTNMYLDLPCLWIFNILTVLIKGQKISLGKFMGMVSYKCT